MSPEQSAPGGTATIFLEGDGIPWIAGRAPASDPTTARPIALQLMTATAGARAYVVRPCYQALADPACEPSLWTQRRYAPPIIESLVAAVREAKQRLRADRIVLVGYSGGGVLATLIAERLADLAAVITIGANLDVDAWARYHGYLALEGSLNPASSTAAHPWPEFHYYGDGDSQVPSATADTYFSRFPCARRRVVPANDHVCCWVEQWPNLHASIVQELSDGAR